MRGEFPVLNLDCVFVYSDALRCVLQMLCWGMDETLVELFVHHPLAGSIIEGTPGAGSGLLSMASCTGLMVCPHRLSCTEGGTPWSSILVSQ
jgi:hypothetical protein